MRGPDHDDHAADRGARPAPCATPTKSAIAALNAELCRAVGITDLSAVVGVRVLLGAGECPRVVVTHRLRPGSPIGTVRQAFRLVPIEKPDERAPP